MLLWTIIIVVGLYMILKNNPAPAPPQYPLYGGSRWGRRPPYGGGHPGHGHGHGGGPGGGHHGGGGWDHDD